MKPHITEKTYAQASADQPVFTFQVKKGTTTAEIKGAIKQQYGQDVISVRFVSNAAKSVRRQKVRGTTSVRRKAIVVLKKGQKIAVFTANTDNQSSSAKATEDKGKK